MPDAKRSIPARPKTRKRYERIAERKRLKLVEVSEMGADVLEALPSKLFERVIEGKPLTAADFAGTAA